MTTQQRPRNMTIDGIALTELPTIAPPDQPFDLLTSDITAYADHRYLWRFEVDGRVWLLSDYTSDEYVTLSRPGGPSARFATARDAVAFAASI